MPDDVTGTFSDISISQRTGDLGGTEIRIVKTGKGYQGAFYMAEGGASDVVLVNNIQYNGQTKRLTLLFDLYGYSRRLAGQILLNNNEIAFTYMFSEAEYTLIKRETFWSYDTYSSTDFRSGDYSSLECDKKANSLSGAELRILEANNFERDGYVGLFQMADGDLTDLMLTEIKIDGDDFFFKVVDQNNAVYGEFKGKYSVKEGIEGVLNLKAGKTINLKLPPKRSYWERVP